MDDGSFGPPPIEPGPIAGCLVNLLGPPILICFALFMGGVGFILLWSIACSLEEYRAVAIPVLALVVGSVLYVWLKDSGVLPIVALVAAFITVILATGDAQTTLAGEKTFLLCVHIALLWWAMRGIKQPLGFFQERGWLGNLLGTFLAGCVGLYFLAGGVGFLLISVLRLNFKLCFPGMSV